MKIKFYQKLNALIESKKDNNSFLSVEKYELLIQQINTLKHGNRKKEPKDYQLLKQYDVVQIGNVEQLIYPVAEGSTSIKYYVQIEDIFNVIHEAHVSIGHTGRNRMVKETGTNKEVQIELPWYKVQKHHNRMYNDLSKLMHSMSKKVESSEKRFGCQANGFQ